MTYIELLCKVATCLQYFTYIQHILDWMHVAFMQVPQLHITCIYIVNVTYLDVDWFVVRHASAIHVLSVWC